MKDWTGNKVSYASTLGARNFAKRDRHNEDYYATDPKAVKMLLEMETFEGKIWECACGEGHLSKEMIRLGYKVISSDIVDRGYGTVYDFLSEDNKHTDCNIITNPPLRYANDFIVKAMQITQRGRKAALFMPIRYLEGKKRNLSQIPS